MRKTVTFNFLTLIIFFMLVSCNSQTPPIVEVTHVVPETVEVTRVVPQTVIVTQMNTDALVGTREPEKTVNSTYQQKTPVPTLSEPNQNTAYYDGLVTIATYIALTEHGLYADAYQLLSQARKNNSSEDDFITNMQTLRGTFTLKILSAQPFYEYAQERGIKTFEDTAYKKYFHLNVYVEGEGGMAGAVPNGIHNYIGIVVWENGGWKISDINP